MNEQVAAARVPFHGSTLALIEHPDDESFRPTRSFPRVAAKGLRGRIISNEDRDAADFAAARVRETDAKR